MPSHLGARYGGPAMMTILLLLGSNLFMTAAWYGHLKFPHAGMLQVILVSWLIALPEYCLQVPGNRLGYGTFSATQLKVIQEAISVSVFVVFALVYLGERPRWNHLVAFALIIAAVYFALLGKSSK